MEISDFLPELYLDAPGVPEPVALNALRNSLRQFCEATEVWSETLDPIALKQGISTYDLDPPYGSEFVTVQSARYGGRPVPLMHVTELDRVAPGWRDQIGTGVSAMLVLISSLRVYPTPAADDSVPLDVSVALRPTLTASTCPDHLSRWNEAITSGALARLKAIANKPWSDREAVSLHEAKFRAGANAALGSVIKGNSRESLSVTPRRFGI